MNERPPCVTADKARPLVVVSCRYLCGQLTKLTTLVEYQETFIGYHLYKYARVKISSMYLKIKELSTIFLCSIAKW